MYCDFCKQQLIVSLLLQYSPLMLSIFLLEEYYVKKQQQQQKPTTAVIRQLLFPHQVCTQNEESLLGCSGYSGLMKLIRGKQEASFSSACVLAGCVSYTFCFQGNCSHLMLFKVILSKLLFEELVEKIRSDEVAQGGNARVHRRF